MKQELVLLQQKKLKPLPMFDLKFSVILRSAEGKFIQCYEVSRHLNSKGEMEFCAMGMVNHLLFGNNGHDVLYPFGLRAETSNVICPVCTDNTGILHVVAHVNDVHKWSFGQIADWLEGEGY